MKKTIYYHDTDCGGVVYYANYLKYMEEARTEYLAERGVFIGDLVKEGIYFVVARQEIDYKAPAHYADTLEISAKILRASTVRIEYGHEVKNQDDQLICLAKTTLVCVDSQIRPRAIPEEIAKRLSE